MTTSPVDQTWNRFIPNFRLKISIRFADKYVGMAQRCGEVAVTAVGMFSKEPSGSFLM